MTASKNKHQKTAAQGETRSPDGQLQLDELAVSKLSVPILSNQVIVRERLLDLLGLQPHPYTLVQGPAGYGKSTLIVSWISAVSLTPAWISLDQDDNDIKRFFFYLVNALRQSYPAFGGPLIRLLTTISEQNVSALLATFIKQIEALDRPIALILDDYHTIQNVQIHGLMRDLMLYRPSNLYIVIASRTQPTDLALPKLRVNRALNEITESDLRFSDIEARDFIQRCTGEVCKDQVLHSMMQRTEGWIAGIQLALLSVENGRQVVDLANTLAGNHQYIADYFVSEVIQRQPESVRNFLIATAGLRRLSGSLCNFVTQRSDSRKILHELVKQNLFIIPLDKKRRWFRYHHLFADWLASQHEQIDPMLAVENHRRACRWYIDHHYPHEAMYHALTCIQDYELAIEIMGKFSRVMSENGEMATVLEWYESIPMAIIRRHPSRILGYAWICYLQTGELKEHLLQNLESILSSSNHGIAKNIFEYLEVDLALLRAIQAVHANQIIRAQKLGKAILKVSVSKNYPMQTPAQVLLASTHFLRGELDQASVMYRKLVKHTLERNYVSAINISVAGYARTLTLQGRLDEGNHYLQTIIAQHKLNGWDDYLVDSTLLHISKHSISFRKNDLTACLRSLERAQTLAKQDKWPSLPLLIELFLARVYISQGSKALGEKILEPLSQKLETPYLMPLFPCINELVCDLYLMLGRFKEAEQRLCDLQDCLQMDNYYGAIRLLSLRLRFHLARAELEPAIKIVSNIRQNSMYQQSLDIQLQVHLMEMQLSLLQGQKNQAMKSLQSALHIGQFGGYIRPFIDAGDRFVELFHEYRRDEDGNDTYFAQLTSNVSPATRHASAGIGIPNVDPALTVKEVEILKLLAEGHSNKRIATQQHVTENTIKTHIKNIYEKLQVSNRTQAASRYRQSFR